MILLLGCQVEQAAAAVVILFFFREHFGRISSKLIFISQSQDIDSDSQSPPSYFWPALQVRNCLLFNFWTLMVNMERPDNEITCQEQYSWAVPRSWHCVVGWIWLLIVCWSQCFSSCQWSQLPSFSKGWVYFVFLISAEGNVAVLFSRFLCHNGNKWSNKRQCGSLK